MNENFRRRIFTPFVMPATIAGGILVFAYALSRVLLAVPEFMSTIIAVVVAGYILLVASMAGQRRTISGRALGMGLLLGLVGLIVAGAVAGAAGIRDLEHGAEGGDAEAGGEEQSAGAAAEDVPEDAVVWESEEGIAYTAAPDTMPAGPTTIALVNASGVPHNVVFEGFEGDQPLVEVAGDGVDIGTVDIPAGTYTYYCSVPGHRQGGMEGEVVVE